MVIDTLNGYLQSAMEEPTILLHIRELVSYLCRRQVVTLLTPDPTRHTRPGNDRADRFKLPRRQCLLAALF